jgi:poly-gamma-glutamate synthesis protein (capsule biosynthesis protein)
MIYKKSFCKKRGIDMPLFAAIAPFLAVLILLSGCRTNGQAGTAANVIGYDQGVIPRIEAVKPLSTLQVIPEDFVYGGIVSASKIDSLIRNIEKHDLYEKVIVIAPTDHIVGDKKFFTYGSDTLHQEKIVFDVELIKKIMKTNFLYSLGEIKVGSFWSGDILPVLQSQFVNAKIVPVSVNRNISAGEAEVFAKALKQNLSGRSLVLALADFNLPEDENLKAYRKDFTETVLTNIDENKIDELPSNDIAAVQVLAGYLRESGAQKMDYGLKEDENINASYIRGKALNDGKIYLTAFGDVMLGRYVRTLMDARGLDYPFLNMEPDYLRVNDILLGNLEGPIAKNAIQTSKSIAFRFMPDTAPLLKKYYFDVLSLANNHAYDMGQAGYDSTKELLDEQGILHFGDARGVTNDTALKMSVRGRKIAFIGLEEVVYKINDEAAVKLVQSLTGEGYEVIPYVHMGIEYQHKANQRQKELLRKLIDAGAILVIAHHPHVVEGYEKYKGRLIFYSLGNAIFDQYWSYDTQEGLSIAIEIGGTVGGNPRVSVRLMPLRIERSVVRLMNDDERKVFFEKFADWSGITGAEKEQVMTGVIEI